MQYRSLTNKNVVVPLMRSLGNTINPMQMEALTDCPAVICVTAAISHYVHY